MSDTRTTAAIARDMFSRFRRIKFTNNHLILLYFLFPAIMNMIVVHSLSKTHRIYFCEKLFISSISIFVLHFLFSIISIFLFFSIKRQRIFLFAYAVIAYAPSLLNVLHAVLAKESMNVSGIGLALNSDLRETMHFINERFSILIILVVLLYLVVCFAGYYIKETDNHSQPLKKYKILTIVAFLSLLCSEQLPFNVFLRGIQLQISQLWEVSDYATTASLSGIKSRISAARQTYVIVIGESVDRKHMSLYGYGRKTTPHLDALKSKLFVFKNPRSAFCHTTDSVREALRIDDASCKNVINFMKDAGFKVFWFSNQGKSNFFDNQIARIASLADHRVFLCNGSDFDTDFFDEELLLHMDGALQDPSEKKVIFLHLIGSHVPLDIRYPEKFKLFDVPETYHDAFKAEMVSHYDNSILYTDDVLKRAIDMLEKSGGCSCLLYFSDHGQDIYDTPESKIFREISSDSQNMYEIPLLVWASDKYKKLNRNFIAGWDLEKNYVIDKLGYSIIDMMRLDHHKVMNRRNSLFR